MLETMRRYASGWVAQILIGILIVSFAIWGIAGALSGINTNTVAQVGGTEISTIDFDRAYRGQIDNLSQQMGQQITPDQAKAFGLPNQVLARLVAQAALDDQASTLALGVSQDTLVKEIADDPAFKGPGGAFDRAVFVQRLRQRGMTEDDYVMEREASEKRRQLAASLSGGATVPAALAAALHNYQTEARTIRYIVIPSSAIPDVGQPNADELTAYYNDHKADWRAPELRDIAYVKMDAVDIVDPAAITDADAQKAYDADKARFTTPETRQVYQLTFTDESTARAAEASLKGGATFESIVEGSGRKLADTDLGVVTKDKLIEPKVADAAFAAPANSSTDVIIGSFGPVIVHVGDVMPEQVKPFDAVKDEIKADLALSAAKSDLSVLRDAIEDAKAGGATLDEIATKNKLKVAKIAVDASGNDAEGKPVADIPAKDALLKAAFESDVGIDNAAVTTADNGSVWYQINSINPAHDRPLDEVRQKVIDAWRAATTEDRLLAKAKEVSDQVAKGQTLDEAAAALSLTVETDSGQTRGSKPPADFSSDALKAAFAGPKGHVATAAGVKDGEQIVLKVDDVTETPYVAGNAEQAPVEKQLAEAIQNDLLQQYVNELQNTLGATINQSTLQRVIGAS
ncbi:peptidylprolyl isomerase [Kaistia algarum]|uniref:peptidylprolyl isomerase n=1 Tax=Kaistia algarum TaxID=2083279 RepID=UPI000CE739E9|nr:peptidylprolyl isomerase [Kaistia algarum]MCX5514590.1 SurA N-terminal domain-containing protein [Kaistia algarum]PPE78965.1 peptidylprolyl isomerase [Kaistia algarum]